MGRYKRKKHLYNVNGNGNGVEANGSKKIEDEEDGEDEEDSRNAEFTNREKARVRQYLQEYRDGAIRCHCDSSNTNNSSSNSSSKKPVKQCTVGGGGGGGGSNNNNNNNKKSIIQFPKLTDEILAKPYLSLPSELSFKQRQFVHQCCIDLHLFHSGIGIIISSTDETDGTTTEEILNHDKTSRKDRKRYVAITIFVDVLPTIEGFDREIPSPLQASSSYNYSNYKPWYYRHSNYTFRDATTKKLKATIHELIDQPSACLRDHRDEINYTKLQNRNLSNFVPPISPLTLTEEEEEEDKEEKKDEEGIIHNSKDNEDDDWMLVDTAPKMKQCIQELKEGNITELAFDIEAYNPSKFCQQTCLLQITTNLQKEYIIDVLAMAEDEEDGAKVWDLVGDGLRPLFTNPNIVKIGHSIGGVDAKCLHRDFGIPIVNVFDTYEAAKVLDLPDGHGLAAVCNHYGLETSDQYHQLKSVYQATDWRKRPLTKEMILYGRYDIHFLIQLRWLMIRDLTSSELFPSWNRNGNAQDDVEGKLVAESLAATLQRIHDFEDGIEFEDHEHHPFIGQQKQQQQQQGEQTDQDDDDDDADAGGDAGSFKTATESIAKDNKSVASTIRGDFRRYETASEFDDDSESDDDNNEIVVDTTLPPPDDTPTTPTTQTTPTMINGGGGGGATIADDDDDDAAKENGIITNGDNMNNTKDPPPTSKEEIFNNPSNDDDDVVEPRAPPPRIATAHELRMQPRLMRVLSMSQEHCLDLWVDRVEPHFRNSVFLAHAKKSTRTTSASSTSSSASGMTQSQIHLYEDLVRLRRNIAQKQECIPAFVCSLDELARIAVGRPTNKDAMRTISYFLPETIFRGLGSGAGDDVMLDQVFALTKQSLRTDKLQQSPQDEAATRKYYNHNEINKEHKDDEKKSSSSSSWMGILGKVALATTVTGVICLVAGAVVVTMSSRSRRQRPR